MEIPISIYIFLTIGTIFMFISVVLIMLIRAQAFKIMKSTDDLTNRLDDAVKTVDRLDSEYRIHSANTADLASTLKQVGTVLEKISSNLQQQNIEHAKIMTELGYIKGG